MESAPLIQMSSFLKGKRASSLLNSTYPVSGGSSPLSVQEKRDECSSFTSFPKVLTQQCPPIRLSTMLNIFNHLRKAFACRMWRKKTPEAISKQSSRKAFTEGRTQRNWPAALQSMLSPTTLA